MDWFISLNPTPPFGLNHETGVLKEVRNKDEDLFRQEGKVKKQNKTENLPRKGQKTTNSITMKKNQPYLFLPWEIMEERERYK